MGSPRRAAQIGSGGILERHVLGDRWRRFHRLARRRGAAAPRTSRAHHSTTSRRDAARNIAAVRDDIEIVEGDLRSYERAHNAVKGADFVIHLAALPSVPRSVQDPLTSNEANVTGTLNIAARGPRRGRERAWCSRRRRPSTGRTTACPSVRTWCRSPSRPTVCRSWRRSSTARAFSCGLRYRDRRAALLQRLRSPAGPELTVQRRGSPLHHVPLSRGASPSSSATACSHATSPTWPTSSTRRSAPRRPMAPAARSATSAAARPHTVLDLIAAVSRATGRELEAALRAAARRRHQALVRRHRSGATACWATSRRSTFDQRRRADLPQSRRGDRAARWLDAAAHDQGDERTSWQASASL